MYCGSVYGFVCQGSGAADSPAVGYAMKNGYEKKLKNV
jgi:hypothetical protein